MMKVGLISFGLLVLYATTCLATDCDVSEKNDCGYLGIDKKGCEDRGCCWVPTALHVQGDPWCFQTDVSSTGTCRPDLDKADCGYLGITEQECMDRKCCWLEKEGDPHCFQKSSAESACIDVGEDKIDCGVVGTTEDECIKKGCCWKEEENEPWCFYKSGVPAPSPKLAKEW